MESKVRELRVILDLVEDFYGFPLKKAGRRQDLIYARKVYVKIARDRNHTFQSIGDVLEMDHSTILYHYNTFNVVQKNDIDAYDKVMYILSKSENENGLIPGFDPDEQRDMIDLIEAKIEAKYDSEIKILKFELEQLRNEKRDIGRLKPMLELVEDWSDDELKDCIDFRIKPYAQALKSRVYR